MPFVWSGVCSPSEVNYCSNPFEVFFFVFQEKKEQKIERFAVGEKIDAVVISYDEKSRKINLSVKQKEIIEDYRCAW